MNELLQLQLLQQVKKVMENIYKTLIEKSRETGMEIETVIGDTAYSEKDNIQYAKENELQLVSKLNPHITQGDTKKEDEFEFNKDAGMYVL